MAATIVASVDSATQTSDFGSDNEEKSYSYNRHAMGNSSPRVVVDTSPPFGSVEEAVNRFGGRGFWIPQPYSTVDAGTATDDQSQNIEVSKVHKLDDGAAAMLKDLQKKEQETYEILKELELTKNLLEDLKQKLPKEAPEYENKYPVNHFSNHPVNNPEEPLNTFPSSTAGMIMMELKQAKHNLYQNTNDLAELRASVEVLSKKIDNEKVVASTEKVRDTNMGRLVNPLAISRELRELNYEADQFMMTAEAAKSEVLKAMSDVEMTKTGLKFIEMRWVVAKKLEDAAKAAESLALAEFRALSSNPEGTRLLDNQQKQGRISLSLDEYSALTDKARKVENLVSKRKEIDGLKKIDEEFDEEKVSKIAAFRNSFPTRPVRGESRLINSNEFGLDRGESRLVKRPTTSIGDILSSKLVLRDDLEVAREEESVGGGRQRVSLNQMLRRHRGESSPLKRREKEGNEGKNFFKKTALGFVHISLPLSKQSKSKIQGLNLWRAEDE